MTDQKLPTDAIELTVAMGKYGHTRSWYKNRMPVYYVGPLRKAYVSESQVQAEQARLTQFDVHYPNQEGD